MRHGIIFVVCMMRTRPCRAVHPIRTCTYTHTPSHGFSVLTDQSPSKFSVNSSSALYIRSMYDLLEEDMTHRTNQQLQRGWADIQPYRMPYCMWQPKATRSPLAHALFMMGCRGRDEALQSPRSGTHSGLQSTPHPVHGKFPSLKLETPPTFLLS